MGYANQVFKVPLGSAGLNASLNSDTVPATASVVGSKNINLHKGGVGKRGGTAHLDAAAMSGTPKIVGLHDFYLSSGTQFIIRATGDGKIYKDDTNTIHTGWTASDLITSFSEMNNKLYINNGTDKTQVWTGTGNTTDLANVPTDWGTAGPKQMVNHGFANAEQMWAFAAPSKPYSVYCSKNNAGGTSEADFSDAEVLTININTGDGYGIIGGFEFQDRIFAVGKKQTYQIQDIDADRANWGYQAAGWTGGASSHRLIAKIPNDVHMMMDDGEIYSITAVQQYGDYKSASLTRPAFINNWIADNVDLSKIDQFHAIYDPELRAVKWFVVRSGKTTVDTALVYFIDKDPSTGWVIHDGAAAGSGYDAVCAALVKQVSTGGYKVYTGDAVGLVWKLEQANRSDNSESYAGVIRTSALNFDDSRTTKRYDRAFVSLQPVGNYNLSCDIIYDGGIDTSSETVDMSGGGAIYGTGVYGTAIYGGATLVEGGFELGYVGKRISFQFSNSSANQDFFISQLLIDFKPVGLRPTK